MALDPWLTPCYHSSRKIGENRESGRPIPEGDGKQKVCGGSPISPGAGGFLFAEPNTSRLFL